MNLPDRINLINAMIKENRDVRICDYLEVLGEMEAIKEPEIIEPVMNTPKLYTSEDADYMIRYANEMTAKQLAARLKLTAETVRNFGTRYGLTFKKPTVEQKRQFREGVIPDKKVAIMRPPSEYNNIKTNYL